MTASRVRLLDGRDPSIAALADHLASQRGGRLINLYRALLHAPPVASAWLDFNTAIRYETTLPAAIVELVILRVAALTGADYQFRAHGPAHALKAGLTEAQIAAVRERTLAGDLFDSAQRAALDCATGITLDLEPTEATWGALREHFDERQQVELVVLASAYNMHTRVARALRLGQDSGPPPAASS